MFEFLKIAAPIVLVLLLSAVVLSRRRGKSLGINVTFLLLLAWLAVVWAIVIGLIAYIVNLL